MKTETPQTENVPDVVQPPLVLQFFTLDAPMTFHEALQALEDGKCLGIRPGANMNYLELWRPHWKRGGWQLRWNRSESDQGVNTEQFLGEWRMVIVDHRQLPSLQNVESIHPESKP